MRKIPIAFFIFKRPDTTEKVFQAIRQYKPKKLYVFADGARQSMNELKDCLDARQLIKIDWECEVVRKFSDINLGCKKSISQGLDFVFENEEMAIVLEDDCFPNSSFFIFCEELLEKYKDDTRVFTISGSNLHSGRKISNESYYFSRYFHCWGWATWKRAWKLNDSNMTYWPQVRDTQTLKEIFDKPLQVKYWENLLQDVYEARIDTWDYQFYLTQFINNGLSIIPEKNLISNIGFDSRATHTISCGDPWANLKTEDMEFPLLHPKWIIRNRTADSFTEKNFFWKIYKSNLKMKASFYLMWFLPPILFSLLKKSRRILSRGKW